jgi:hypothetical protein
LADSWSCGSVAIAVVGERRCAGFGALKAIRFSGPLFQADTDVEVLVLGRPALDELREHHPRLYGTILGQLLVAVAQTATRLDREVAALAEG